MRRLLHLWCLYLVNLSLTVVFSEMGCSSLKFMPLVFFNIHWLWYYQKWVIFPASLCPIFSSTWLVHKTPPDIFQNWWSSSKNEIILPNTFKAKIMISRKKGSKMHKDAKLDTQVTGQIVGQCEGIYEGL